MKILIGDKGHIDFDEPILMSPEQRESFVEMMRALFSVVHLEESDKFRLDRLGDKIFARTWTTDELKYLLEIKDIDTICEGLGRSWMSVDIKRGEFIPEFMSWAHERGYDIVQGDTKSIIEKFMEDKEIEKQERKEARKQQSSNVDVLKRKFDQLNKKQEAIHRRRRVGLKYPGDEEALSNLKAQIYDIEEKIKQKESDRKHDPNPDA